MLLYREGILCIHCSDRILLHRYIKDFSLHSGVSFLVNSLAILWSVLKAHPLLSLPWKYLRRAWGLEDHIDA